MDNNSEKSRPGISIKAIVDLIKDIGFGMALIVSSAVLSKESYFDTSHSWLLVALFLIGFFIALLSPLDFHSRYFGFHGSMLKRALSFLGLLIIYCLSVISLCCVADYFGYIIRH
ncbi:hypothetical protein [Zymobacter sp. IVIA_5232.4 C2]|uniref:hypothetical protein n=1 Tax=Zymobacter sp. IVIA_5232.4 C2 TaxID=3394855 RepID=UPI0039C17E4C